jgi:hypothetical protein
MPIDPIYKKFFSFNEQNVILIIAERLKPYRFLIFMSFELKTRELSHPYLYLHA